jgi:hypothetical protein
VKAQLALVSKPLPRPSKLVEQELGWEPLLPEAVRRVTRDCTRLVGDAMPQGCKKRVEGIMASGHEYRRKRGRTHGRSDHCCKVKILLANPEPMVCPWDTAKTSDNVPLVIP